MNARTERTIAFNRRNILDAADRLFCKNGVEKTTMEQLAAEAGYSKPTLYGYFKDKDEVFFALVLEFMQKVTVKVDRAIKEFAMFTDCFTAICENLFRLAMRYPLYFEGLIGDVNVNVKAEETPMIYKDIYHLGEILSEKLTGVLRQGKSEGVINQGHSDEPLLLFLWSSISGIIRMINRKSEYFKLMQISEKEFSKFCFNRLLSACKLGESL